jgi:hypothetical protein
LKTYNTTKTNPNAPQNNMDTKTEAAKTVQTTAALAIKARRIYREAGGEMKMTTPSRAVPADARLWAQCRKIAANTRALSGG